LETKRISGFVIARDGTTDKPVWKVRVKQPGHALDGQKLIVASAHDDIALAKGLNVNFLIGTVDNQQNASALRAVDVCLTAEGSTENKGQQVTKGANDVQQNKR
jgi:hypothetical protein